MFLSPARMSLPACLLRTVEPCTRPRWRVMVFPGTVSSVVNSMRRVSVGEVAAVCHSVGAGAGWRDLPRPALDVTVFRVRTVVGVGMSRARVLILIAGGAVAANASAHHGIANFDLNKDIAISGTVSKLAF